MTRRLPLALAFALAFALSGCGPRACKDGTVFLTISLGELARGASLVAVEADVDGGDQLIGNFALKTVDGGTVEIDFPSGYPEGKNITLHVSATMGAASLATSRLVFVATPGCTAVSITVGALDGGMGCEPAATQCSSDGTMLLTCRPDGSDYDATACASGCKAIGQPAHCAVLEPSGTADQTDYTGTAPLMFMHDVVFDTDQGTITETGGFSRPAGPGVQAGVGWRSVSQPGSTVRLGIFGVKGLALAAGAHLTVAGKSPLVIVSSADVTLAGTVDLTGDCKSGPFAGGGASGTPMVNNGDGLGGRGGRAGSGGLDTASGGGGAGFSDVGGAGGNGMGSTGGAGGGIFGDLTVEPLVLIGGSGGGAGVAPSGLSTSCLLGGAAPGGAGGGALQLSARHTITVTMGQIGGNGAIGGIVNVGGGGGAGGCGGLTLSGSGGGGGSGGSLLLEAVTVDVKGILGASGGGAGGGGGLNGFAVAAPQDGQAGHDGLDVANGFNSSGGGNGSRNNNDNGGGNGANTIVNTGGPDTGRMANDSLSSGGGGGGGFGRIYLRAHGAPSVNASSPNAVVDSTLPASIP